MDVLSLILNEAFREGLSIALFFGVVLVGAAFGAGYLVGRRSR